MTGCRGGLMFLARTLIVPLSLIAAFAVPGRAQQAAFSPDLRAAAQGDGWEVRGRTVAVGEEGGRSFLRLNEALGSGIVRLQGVEFGDGQIEMLIRGKNVPQRSFVGLAFHGLDDETYEAVYFRPFNFTSDEPSRRSHGVQYVAHPAFTWQRLRAEHPGAYEQPVEPAPDPDGWFRVRVVVRGRLVSVYVNDANRPSLEVERLVEPGSGWMGLFVGSGSGGDFADLQIMPRE